MLLMYAGLSAQSLAGQAATGNPAGAAGAANPAAAAAAASGATPGVVSGKTYQATSTNSMLTPYNQVLHPLHIHLLLLSLVRSEAATSNS